MTVTRPRLAAAERRAAVLEAACRVFSSGSYRGTTTAEIAHEAGVTEPILYRHFGSKRDLYLACLEEAWTRVRAMWEEAMRAEPDPGGWLAAMSRAAKQAKPETVVLSTLWIQALTEAGEDPEIRRYLRRHLRQVHEFVAGVIRLAQEAGGILSDRDPRAEAWIFISLGLLGTVGRRLGGLVEDDLEQIRASRRRWLTGRD